MADYKGADAPIRFKYKDDRSVYDINRNGDVIWLSARAFDALPGIRLAVATRYGGVSTGMYESMNLSVSQGDDPELVKENFSRLGEACGIPAGEMVLSQQTHTTNLRYCTREDCGKGVFRHRGYTDVDGLYTDQDHVALVISFADCVPVFLADTENRVIAAVHSGWRGTVGKIGKKAADLMAREYGSRPEHIRALIGPSICQDCYEVDDPVIDRFREAYSERDWERIWKPAEGKDDRYQLDLWEACRLNLLEAGLTDGNITVTNICTCCNPAHIFSHRATKGKRGVTVGMIEMV